MHDRHDANDLDIPILFCSTCGWLCGASDGISEAILGSSWNMGYRNRGSDVRSRLHQFSVFWREMEFDFGVGLGAFQDAVNNLRKWSDGRAMQSI